MFKQFLELVGVKTITKVVIADIQELRLTINELRSRNGELLRENNRLKTDNALYIRALKQTIQNSEDQLYELRNKR